MAATVAGVGGAIGDIFGGVGDLFAASGDKAAAKGYYRASGFATQNAELTKQSTKIKEVQASREIYQTLGGQQADIAGAGLADSGSALDVIRSSAEQGALTKQLIGYQGLITQHGYEAEAASYLAQGKAMKAAAKGKTASGIGGIITGVASVAAMFSDDRIKEDTKLLYRRPDGIGIWSFRFKGQPDTFEGVMASEVRQVMPAAVERDVLTGLDKVDYDMIGVTPRILKAA